MPFAIPNHPYAPAQPTITPRIAAELIHHEGIVREAYRDSIGVWTWSVGLTDASGHRVRRYRDQPQSLHRCLEVYVWVLRNRYLPAVIEAFGPVRPAEHELAAALSFHWNTGAIGRAEWMARVRAGERAEARRALMNWCRPAALAARRKRERALFFEGRWAGDGSALVYRVAKPSYAPVRPERQMIGAALGMLLAAGPTVESDTTPAPPVQHTAPAANWFTRLWG